MFNPCCEFRIAVKTFLRPSQPPQQDSGNPNHLLRIVDTPGFLLCSKHDPYLQRLDALVEGEHP